MVSPVHGGGKGSKNAALPLCTDRFLGRWVVFFRGEVFTNKTSGTDGDVGGL